MNPSLLILFEMSEKIDESKAKQTEHINSEKNFFPSDYEDYGYFFYPERWGKIYKPSWYSMLLFSGSRENIRKVTCETNVKDALENRKKILII